MKKRDVIQLDFSNNLNDNNYQLQQKVKHMYWFISALIVASAIFFLIPQKAAVEVSNTKLKSDFPLSLLILPLGVFSWLVLDTLSNGGNTATVAAFGFVSTACLIAQPKLHRYIMPSALLTVLALIAMVVERF